MSTAEAAAYHVRELSSDNSNDSATHQPMLYELILLQIPGLGPAARQRLIERFDSLDRAFNADARFWPIKLSADVVKQLNQKNGDLFNKASACIQWCKTNLIHILTQDMEDYPKNLRHIDAAPFVLFAKGNLELLALPCIGIVGTRHPSQSGINTTRDFSKVLAGAGFCIVSGLAKGVDAIAHSAAMESEGSTIAVLGTGIDKQYPHCNRALYQHMDKTKQLIISEFWPGTIPSPKNFPRRNRIISALSLGVLVTEAAVKSGSLVTARYAAEQGKEVFAVPGSIHNPMAKGCHHLINQGARLIQDAHELVDGLRPQLETLAAEVKSIETATVCPDSPLWQFIGYEPSDLDTLVAQSGLDVSQVLEALTLLELDGVIACENGGYIRVK